MQTVEFKGKNYLQIETTGNAARFIRPFAMEILNGKFPGIDVGCGKMDWKLPMARFCADPAVNDYDALHFPEEAKDLGFVFSSHCLEHVDNWIETLDYWTEKLASGGILFLYLPDYSQEYWRPWHNRKHKHIMVPDQIRDYLIASGNYRENTIYVSGVDLLHSFAVVAEKT